jgi:dTDP-3-amino-3,4,6-trideoxy-alpha-D-glucose transaminase
MNVPFVDLAADYRALKQAIDRAVARVLAGGWYILGQEVAAFEAEFAAYCGVGHAVGVASGTDALLLALRALAIGPGDEVITVSHTAVATVTAVTLSGATPVLVDVEPAYYTLDPAAIVAAISPRTKALIPVHLYGQPANLDEILAIARQYGLFVVEDCAQAHGALYHGRRVGSFGHLAAFSFYPTKNLGAMGDGGAVVTTDGALAERLRWLRQYGWQERYISAHAGYNSRLDELQAAVLRVKLAHLDAANEARRALAGAYWQQLADLPLVLPEERPLTNHVYHLFVIQTAAREALQARLAAQGIGTAVHYPVPIHRQPAYAHLPARLPVTERLAERILSLPLAPHLTMEALAHVCRAIKE